MTVRRPLERVARMFRRLARDCRPGVRSGNRRWSGPYAHVEKLGNRLRLCPPYREHLAQAFARFFMRVGLPSDIPEERIRAKPKA
jgi:hypothetical protein